MSEDNGGDSADGQGGALNARLLGIVTAAIGGLVLLVSVISMFLVIGLMAQVTTLEEQGRKAAKANKALQEEVTALKETMRSAAPQPAPEVVAPRPTNIDAADPANDCVIRSGDKTGVANCVGIDLKGKVK